MPAAAVTVAQGANRGYGAAVQVQQWLCRRGSGCVGHGRLGLEGAGPATGGSGGSGGYWRLRVWEEIGMRRLVLSLPFL